MRTDALAWRWKRAGRGVALALLAGTAAASSAQGLSRLAAQPPPTSTWPTGQAAAPRSARRVDPYLALIRASRTAAGLTGPDPQSPIADAVGLQPILSPGMRNGLRRHRAATALPTIALGCSSSGPAQATSPIGAHGVHAPDIGRRLAKATLPGATALQSLQGLNAPSLEQVMPCW